MNRTRARKVHLARSQRRSAKRRQIIAERNRGHSEVPRGLRQPNTIPMPVAHSKPTINIMDWLADRRQQRRQKVVAA